MRRACLMAGLLVLARTAVSCSVGCGGSASERGTVRGDVRAPVGDDAWGSPGADAVPDRRVRGAPDDGGGVADVLFGGPRFGQTCEGYDGCPEGWRVDGLGGSVCTVRCEDYCPEGCTCKLVDLTGGADQTYVLSPSRRGVSGSAVLPSGATRSRRAP